MPVPSTQEIRKPLLEAFRDEAPHSFVINEFLAIVAEYFDENLDEMSSTEKTALKNNINEAKTYLRKHKLLSHPSKNTYMITPAGSKVLEDNPEFINDDYFAPKEIQAPAPEIISEAVEPEPVIEEIQEPAPEPQTEFEIEPEVQEQEEQEFEAEIPVDFSEQEFNEAPEEEVGEVENAGEEFLEEPEAEEAEELSTEELSEDIVLEDEPEPELKSEAEEVEPEEINEIISEAETQEDFFDEADDPIDNEKIFEDENENENENKIEEEEFESEDEELKEQEQEQALEEETEISEEPEEIYNDENNSEISEEQEPMPELENEEKISSGDVQEIEEVLAGYNSKLADEVLEKVARLQPEMFCMLVIDLLSKMGYNAFQSARYAADSDLIHGVILDNKPGMNPIYIQARKLSPSRTIGKADMLDFINALADKGGKGIFATTGTFSEQAEIIANDERIMLLDGKKLAGLMIAHNFCINVEKIIELKSIDTESFSEYEA